MTMSAVVRNRQAVSAASTQSQSPHKLHLSLPMSLPMFVFVSMLLLAVVPLQPCESRYLPTRSHGDELDKLRELMLQILELSNEDPQQQQQQQQQQHQMRLHNEANNPLTAQRAANSQGNSNAAWLQKLGAMGALDTDAGYGRY